jgi:hypothetical protein
MDIYPNLLSYPSSAGVKGRTGKAYVIWCLTGTFIYFALSSLIALACLNLGSIDIQSKLFSLVYYRGDHVYNSEFFNFGKFLYFWVMMLVGYTFVNVVTLENVRGNPTFDNHMNSKSFKKVAIFLIPFLFVMSMNVNLRGKYDLVSRYHQTGGELMTVEDIYEELSMLRMHPMAQLGLSMNYRAEKLSRGHI